MSDQRGVEERLDRLVDWPQPAPPTRGRRRARPAPHRQDFGIEPAPPTPAVMPDEARHWVAYVVLNGNIISRTCACQWGICSECDQGHHDRCLTRQLHGDGGQLIPDTTVAFWRLGSPVPGISPASSQAGPVPVWLGCRYRCPCRCPKTPRPTLARAGGAQHTQLDLFRIDEPEG